MIPKFVDDFTIRDYFCASDLIAQTYKKASQSGVTPIAYKYNLPILVSNVKGLKEIILDDITVSRNHGFISVDDERITISDEKSTNGIFVNGELTTESKLESGYRIQIGKFNLIITKVEK